MIELTCVNDLRFILHSHRYSRSNYMRPSCFAAPRLFQLRTADSQQRPSGDPPPFFAPPFVSFPVLPPLNLTTAPIHTASYPRAYAQACSARLSFISIELLERQLPPDVDAAALAATPPPESELPPLLPYSYVTPEFAERGNMVELVINGERRTIPVPYKFFLCRTCYSSALDITQRD